MNWKDIEYLSSGNERQQKAYRILKHINILTILNEYDPILVGTIPIGIDIANSDLDIICNVKDFDQFGQLISKNFSSCNSFSEYYTNDAYIVSFSYSNTEIEIYAINKPTLLQNGYRHMIIEYSILNIAGNEFREEIIKLKEQGYKTEPAFGKLLNLEKPYTDLLKLEKLSDNELLSFLRLNSHLVR